MKMLLSIAAGGAVGAVSRYLVMIQVGHWLGTQFPFATLAVNIIGGFLLGSLIELTALVWSPGQELRAFLVIGLMGGFTTFSTFSMDMFYLMERGDAAGLGLYVAASVIVAVLAFYGGMTLVRLVAA